MGFWRNRQREWGNPWVRSITGVLLIALTFSGNGLNEYGLIGVVVSILVGLLLMGSIFLGWFWQ